MLCQHLFNSVSAAKFRCNEWCLTLPLLLILSVPYPWITLTDFRVSSSFLCPTYSLLYMMMQPPCSGFCTFTLLYTSLQRHRGHCEIYLGFNCRGISAGMLLISQLLKIVFCIYISKLNFPLTLYQRWDFFISSGSYSLGVDFSTLPNFPQLYIKCEIFFISSGSYSLGVDFLLQVMALVA